MKSISFVLTQLNVGGAEMQVAILARSLAARGWKVQVISLRRPKALTELFAEHQIPVYSLDLEKKLPNLKKLLQISKILLGSSVVHSHQVHSNIFARLMRSVLKFPILVCTAHNIYEGSKLRDVAYRLTDSLCSLTTNVSRAAVQRYVQDGLCSPSKIIYVPNAIDISVVYRRDESNRDCLRRSLGIEDEFVWLAVGRFVAAKDYANLIESFSMVVHQQKDCLLLIAGDGEQYDYVKELACNKGVENHVKFLGRRDDVPLLMLSADAYVMSSAWEGLPMVLLEASMAELPIVTTGVGGNSEIVIDGKTGFIVEPKSPDSLSRMMLNLMKLSKKDLTGMGGSGRAHVESNYSVNKVVNGWEDIYSRLAFLKGIEL